MKIKLSQTDNGGSFSARLSDENQTIGGIAQLSSTNLEAMEANKNNLEFQFSLCETMMRDGTILPFPFGRSVILLMKAKRYSEALAVCQYIEAYCAKAEKDWDGLTAMQWKSPVLQQCIARIPKIAEKLDQQAT